MTNLSFTLFKKVLSTGICLSFFIVNGPLAYSNEANFWSSRRAASDQMRRNGAGMGNGGSTDGQMLLAQLPKAGPLEFGQAVAASADQEAQAPKEPFSIGPKTGDWLGKLVLPYGSVREVYLSPDTKAPFIVHIQDAHGIEEAQRNISSMIGQLAQEPGIRLVGLEGASGSFSLEPYRDYPDASITKDIADLFLKKGLIAGPEYAGLTLPKSPDFFGAEDNILYTANVNALKKAFKGREAAQETLSSLQHVGEKLKDVHYSAGLKTFDRHFNDYHSDKEKLATYVRYILNTHQSLQKPQSVPNMALLVKALDEEESLDFKRVELERKQLVERLVGKLSAAQIQDLVAKSVDYRAGRVGYGDYHNQLKKMCVAHGIKFSAWPQLNRYLAYVVLADKIDRNELLNEMEALDRSIPERLARNEKERQLVAVAFDLSLVAKLLRHEMSVTDWTAYESRMGEIHRLAERLTAMDASVKVKGLTAETLKPYEDFCFFASQRNNALTDNLLRQMADTKGKSAVLVAGGFHTEGLSALLRKKQVSYVVVTPKISDIPKDNTYLDVLANDPLPLEKTLAGDRIYLAKLVGLANPESPSGRQMTALQRVRQRGQKLVEYFNNRAFTTDPSKGEVLGRLTIASRSIYLVQNYQHGNWIKSGATGLKSFVVALGQKLTVTTELAEGSFFIVRDLRNGTVEKEVKEIIGPKENSHQYRLSEKDRETVAQLTLAHIELIRSAVQDYFKGRDLIPTFSIQDRRLKTHKVIGKSFFDLIRLTPRFAADLEWKIKTENLCQGAIVAANTALGLSYGERKLMESGWKIEVDRTFTNFIFDDAGNLISWIDPISAWPPESYRIPEKTRSFYTPFFQSFGRRLAVIGIIIPFSETVVLLGARALLTSLGMDPTGGIFLFSMGLFFAAGTVIARSIENKPFSAGEVLWWIGGGALFTHLLGFENGFAASFAAHVVINAVLVVLQSVRIASLFPKISAVANHIPYFSFMPDSLTEKKPQLLTGDRLRRNRAIAEHTKGLHSVLSLAAGFDLNHVLTIFPDATEVVMVGKEYEALSAKEVVDLMQKGSLSPGALDYQMSVLENGFAPGTLVERKTDQASFLALELMALNVDPASVEGSSHGLSFFVPNDSGGGRKIRVRFRNAELGSRSAEGARGGISDLSVAYFDGLFIKAGESLGVELPIVLNQISPLLNSQTTLVLNNFSWNLRHTPGSPGRVFTPEFETRFIRTFSIPAAAREDRLSLYSFTRTERLEDARRGTALREKEKSNPKIARTHLPNKFIRLRILIEERLAAQAVSRRPLRILYVSKDEIVAGAAAGRSSISVRANRSLPMARVPRDIGRRGRLESGRILLPMWTKSLEFRRQEFPAIVFDFSTLSNYQQKSKGSPSPDIIIFIDENGSPEPLPSGEEGKTKAGIDTFRISDSDTPTLLNSLAQTFGGLNKGKPLAVNRESPRQQIKETDSTPTPWFWATLKNGMDRFIDDVFRAPVREAEKIVSMDLRRYRDDHSWSREGRVTRGLGWMGMGVIATVSLGLMAAAPYAVLLGFGLSQQVAMIISLAFAGVGAVASPAWVMGSTLIAHIAQNALARLMNPGLKILGLATIPIWNLDSPLANLTLQEIVERNQLKAKGSFVLFLNKLADLTKRDTEDESLFFFADLESWSYEHPPQVTKALSNLIQIIHKDLIRTFPVYSKLAAKESPGKFLNNAGNILVFWSDHYLLLVSPPKNSNQFNRAHQLIGTTIKSSGSPSLTIDSLIGFGTFGNAYRAIDSNGKPYLVKTSVQPDKITTLAMTLARTGFLLHEGNLLKRLSQRLKAGDKKLTGSFPEFYGFAGTANSTIAFISEFIAGKTLFDLVRDPQGNESLSFSAATELVNSVSSLHQAGFVHRDIKSNNIIIDTKGHPRLIDFGGALQFQDKLEREIPEETLNDDLASFNETNVPDDISIPLTKPGFDYFHLWSLFNKTLPLFKDLDPLLKTNPTDLVGKKNRNLILARDPFMAKVFKIWEEQKVRFFIDVVLRISSSAEKAEATRNWLIDTETLIEKLQTDENANLLNQQKENPPLNNIFVRILMVFFSSSVAEKWGMRLLPVEVGGIIGTGWMASAWGTGLFPGVLLLDPAGVGGLVMVGGLALFKGLHYGLAYIQFGLGRGEKPVLSLSGFANEFSYFLPYVALPFLASNAVLFAAGAAVAAYIHYSYDNKLLSAEKTADAIVEKINTTTDPTERMALNAVVGALMMKGRVSELNLKRVSGGSAYWTQQDLVQSLMEYGDGQAVEALQSSEAKSNALTVLAHLMVQEEGQGPGVRTLLDFMSFNSWEKEVQETAKTMIEGLTKARQPVLLLHDGTGDTNAVLAKLGITLNSTQVDLIDTQEADPGITMTQVVMDYNARTSGKGVPLASTVLVQNDQSILMDLDGFSTQKYSDLTKAIKKALDTMIAVLKSA